MVGVSTSAAEQVSTVQNRKPAVEAARELVSVPREESRARPRRREITGHDEAALSWFFGQGLSIYEKSTFGPIVEKIASDGFASTVCGRCDGGGILEDGGIRLEDKCKGCGGDGRHPRKAGESQIWCLTCDGKGRVLPYELEVEHGGWCPACRGTGSGSVERRAMRRTRCGWCRPDPWVTATDERTGDSIKLALVTAWVPRHCCPNCLGTGDEPITVRQVQKADEAGGVIGNDAALTRFAITSRRADAVKAISPALHAALEAFYGDVGHRWAQSSFGRMFALFHLTPAGKTLARMGLPKDDAPKKRKKGKGKKQKAEKNHDDALAAVQLNAQERIGVQAVLQQSQPKEQRKKLLDAARAQAADLYTRAAGAWNDVATPKSAKAALKRLDASLRRLGHDNVADFVRSQGGAR